MASTLKEIEFTSFFNNSLGLIHEAKNEALLKLLLQSLFLRRSPLQQEVYTRWIQFNAQTATQLTNTLRRVLYDILTKPIELEMGGRYFQLFGDAPELQIPADLPCFAYVLQLYPLFEPYFETKRMQAPLAICHFAKYKHNTLLASLLRRDLICLNFLQFFVALGDEDGYSVRRELVNNALRDLFVEFNEQIAKQRLQPNGSMKAVFSIAQEMGMAQENGGFGSGGKNGEIDHNGYDDTPSYSDSDF